MRYLVKVSYNGSKFYGFQYQKKARTVQDEIERVLNRMHKKFVRIHPAGRTDAGVHATEQYVHFDSNIDIPEDKWKFAINSGLPADILIHRVQKIDDDYHVRFHSKGKAYRYRIYQGADKDPFQNGLKVYYPYSIDEHKMRDTMQYFIGTHDFTSFSSAKSEIENKVRSIHRFDLVKTEDGYDFVIVGSGFLYNMVRILVAYVLEAGQGRLDGSRIPEIMEAQDRKYVPRTAPAEGLYLERVFLSQESLEKTLEEMKNNFEKH